MAKIDSFSFGSIVVEGKKYSRDVLIFPDGSVKKRKGGFWKYGSHAIKKREIEELVKANPEVVIVGTGTDAKAKLESGVESLVKEAKMELVTFPSKEAIERLNQLVGENKRVSALIHITC